MEMMQPKVVLSGTRGYRGVVLTAEAPSSTKP